MILKNKIKKILISFKNKKKNVIIDKTANISLNANFEGYNKVGSNTFFVGYLGKGSYIGGNCEISAKVGRFTSIGRNIRTVQGVHPINNFVSTHPSFFSTKKQAGFTYVNQDKFVETKYADSDHNLAVLIGNDVWIGDNVCIMAGVKIGDGAVIGAGALVTHDVQPYEIVGGVPAKTIRFRFDNYTIKRLLELQWWNKSDAWIKQNADSFENINHFLKNINE